VARRVLVEQGVVEDGFEWSDPRIDERELAEQRLASSRGHRAQRVRAESASMFRTAAASSER
jgi:hypothetical protein